jgi:transcriptional regulator with XRE-family HTH domain
MPEQSDQRLDYRRAITELRERRRMSREALAEAAGISASYLYEVERGLKRPSTDVLAKLAMALGMLPSQMLEYMERQMPPPAPEHRLASHAMASPATRRESAAKHEPDAPATRPPAPPRNPSLEALMAIAQELDDEDVRMLLEFARRLRERNPSV